MSLSNRSVNRHSPKPHVRAGYAMVGTCEAQIFRPPARPQEGRDIIRAAEEFERHTKQRGARNGALGHVALELLRLMVALRDRVTGRLEPAISYLCSKLKRSPDAVNRGKANLREHGFLSWVRRAQVADTAGEHGPQIKQATNAYRLSLPEAARRLLPARWQPAPPPMDAADALAERARELARYTATETPEAAAGHAESPDLRAALDRIARNWREYGKRSQYPRGDILTPLDTRGGPFPG